MLFRNSFIEPKKTKYAKEAVVEDEDLEMTIEEKYPSNVSLLRSEISESNRIGSAMEVSNVSIRTLILKSVQ